MAIIFENACVIRGGQEVAIDDRDRLLAEYQQGMPVLPPRLVMLDEKDSHKPSPAATMLDRLAREGGLKRFMDAFFLWPSEDGLGNAHEVAESLMVDLMIAGQSDGWVWVMGDIWTGELRRYLNYSWLEYEGWAVDAACGLVRICPRGWFRAVFKARKLKIRDAAQTRKRWRGHGVTELITAIDAQVPEGTAKVYDFATKKVTEMPTCELAAGMAIAQVAGVEGPVWVDMTQAKLNTQYFHPPFPKEMRQQIAWIADTLGEVQPMSLDDWEDGFRRDCSAQRQIFIHTCIAETYKRFTTDTDLLLIQKQELFRAIVQATVSTREAFLAIVGVSAISKAEAVAAADMYWRVFHERGGIEKCSKWDAEAKQRLRDIQDGHSGAAA